ncbi:hypothetical protein BaRGS_00000775 [Batillaria attramentaria]|uniref:Uncharacterized protein n=1 Tax=Batillaria attramentaria TaxID=370345 RepID=A0ABD0M8H6_9CAEN
MQAWLEKKKYRVDRSGQRRVFLASPFSLAIDSTSPSNEMPPQAGLSANSAGGRERGTYTQNFCLPSACFPRASAGASRRAD